MPDDKKPLTKEQVEVYEAIFKMAMQFLLILASLVAFFIILYYLIKAPDFNNKIVYGAFNLILSGTTFVVYRFYFTNGNKKAKAKPKPATAAAKPAAKPKPKPKPKADEVDGE